MFYEYYGRDSKWIQRGEEAVGKALQVNPQLAEGLAGRGRMYYAQEQYEKAIQFAKLAIAQKPDCEGAYDLLGRALFASGRFQEAADIIDKAVEANGDDYNVYIPYTNALDRLGRSDVSRRFREMEVLVLERQLEAAPEDVRARVLLAADYANIGRAEDAMHHAEMAAALRPKDSGVLYNVACTYGALGRKPEALAMLRRSKDAGYSNEDWIHQDPDLQCLHDDPEFISLFPPRDAKH
jgi:adenylate cyclase